MDRYTNNQRKKKNLEKKTRKGEQNRKELSYKSRTPLDTKK